MYSSVKFYRPNTKNTHYKNGIDKMNVNLGGLYPKQKEFCKAKTKYVA